MRDTYDPRPIPDQRDWETTPATSNCRVPSHPYRRLQGQALADANREYREHGTGIRAEFEERWDRDCEFDRMTGRAPGGEGKGPLADLDERFAAIVAAHAAATAAQ